MTNECQSTKCTVKSLASPVFCKICCTHVNWSILQLPCRIDFRCKTRIRPLNLFLWLPLQDHTACNHTLECPTLSIACRIFQKSNAQSIPLSGGDQFRYYRKHVQYCLHVYRKYRQWRITSCGACRLSKIRGP